LSEFPTPAGVTVTGSKQSRYDEVLDATTLDFLAGLHRRFESRRKELLAIRFERDGRLASGDRYDFLPETRHIREGEWKVPKPAAGLIDRRVEITGPTDRKMTVNALNSGAKVWLADFEDATTPLWTTLIDGQLNLRDALDHTIDFEDATGKGYKLGDELATIVARPRGWQLIEKHLLVDHEPISGSLFDFGLYFSQCAKRQLAIGRGPYFYLPKMESHLEARLWDEVFTHAEEWAEMPSGTIRATVLIETIPAAFEMDEILYELRQHSAGLNAGRWDYLFSLIKKFRSAGQEFVLPDRNSVTMAAPFMRAYAELLVETCHRRGAHAIGGMAAFVPSRRDPEVNAVAMAKVRADKEREAAAGFDGSWVAHPDLVDLCSEVFSAVLGDRSNQLDRQRDKVSVTASDILDVASAGGEITEAGLRNDVSVCLQYLSSWLRGTGAVTIFNLMEDAATAEITRSQVWQWAHNGIYLSSGEQVTADLVNRIADEELMKIAETLGDDFDSDAFGQARALFTAVALADDFAGFLTIPAYDALP
jgi:malate synthase